MSIYDGKKVLITGASAGIGYALSEELAKRGSEVIVTARRKDRLEALAQKIASRSAQSIRDGKHIFYKQIEMPLSDAFSLANKAMRDAVTQTQDAEEGRRAFLDKNSPKWTGL